MVVFDIETVTEDYPQIRVIKNRGSWPPMMYQQVYKYDYEMGNLCPICDIQNKRKHFDEDLFKI